MDAATRDLLQELLRAYGPGGDEDAVRDVCARELAPLVDRSWVDAAGNLVGLLSGPAGSGRGAVRVTAHLDELAMVVKRVAADGDLHVQPLGTMYPANFGLGPVDVLGDAAVVTGVLTLGSEHTTQETPQVWATKPDGGDRAMTWTDVRVFTGRSPQELADAGVHVGSRVCVHRSRRELVDLGAFVGCFFLDDRLALVVLLRALRLLRRGGGPAGDVYAVFSTREEVGGVGAAYADRTLPGEEVLALDVAPAEDEYGTSLHPGVVVPYADGTAVYDRRCADRLVELAEREGVPAQRAVLGSYGSDASDSSTVGQVARAVALGLPTLSTHGFEVVHRDVVDGAARVLAAYLR
ncbi:M42 family metallopeptidase [Kineococcus sp. SYSU DK004]|uniref:M42 family metallopeptidase n=1 Tax=Kineococcus sp. SYSU DK004 TaxID=3383125 RepID=UPI003D7CB2FC